MNFRAPNWAVVVSICVFVAGACGSSGGSSTAAPSAPVGLRAVAGDGRITLTWTGTTAGATYNLYWKTSPGVTSGDQEIPGVTTPYVHDHLSNGITCYYVVTAEVNGRESALSLEASATPQAGTSSAPTLTVVRSGSWAGTVTGSGIDCGSTCTTSLANGTQVLLTAVAANGGTVSKWSGCDAVSGTVCSLSLLSDRVVTVEFAPCIPNCTARACGGDGCGGSCGTCPGGQACDVTGKCVACIPTCAVDSCAADGCGSTCACAVGKSCDSTSHCVAGTCSPNCSGRQCGPDPNCGTTCGSCSGTDQQCDVSGRCVLICQAGTGHCDGNSSNGCETNLNTDTSNCGACGHVCTFAHGTASCAPTPPNGAPACHIASCTPPYMNCDDDISNGCEADALTDPNHCGNCAHACGAGQICSGGACQAPAPTCSDGIKNGQETDVDCGGPNCAPCVVGEACVVNTDCTGSQVTCAPAGGGGRTCQCAGSYAHCGGDPRLGCESNLKTDANNCGSCWKSCGAGQQCEAGQCITTFNVTIQATLPIGAIAEPIFEDGSITGFTTPHTFTGLTGTHTFTVPTTGTTGVPFDSWDTGETSNTVTVSSGGTYTARYRTYDVTIWAWNPDGWIGEPIFLNGADTAATTPHTFTNLHGSNVFQVPWADVYGHLFSNWDTGETSTTITVTQGGTHTARYGL